MDTRHAFRNDDLFQIVAVGKGIIFDQRNAFFQCDLFQPFPVFISTGRNFALFVLDSQLGNICSNTDNFSLLTVGIFCGKFDIRITIGKCSLFDTRFRA